MTIVKVTIEVPERFAAEVEALKERAASGAILRLMHVAPWTPGGVPFRFVPDDEAPE